MDPDSPHCGGFHTRIDYALWELCVAEITTSSVLGLSAESQDVFGNPMWFLAVSEVGFSGLSFFSKVDERNEQRIEPCDAERAIKTRHKPLQLDRLGVQLVQFARESDGCLPSSEATSQTLGLLSVMRLSSDLNSLTEASDDLPTAEELGYSGTPTSDS
ncbi:hypothetical protein RRG08_035118 [Elysia crispata]|uniref:Uncharacterized protein n=1 Tax=Elysia crispata TaxID=231223 RepID=A0AAE1A7J2_9GAST|nr:hypothetical protein RRG08_035118 [Elysia crispata]